jgi:hypothetical protein
LKIPFIKIGLVEWRNVKALSSSPSTEKKKKQNQKKPQKTKQNKKPRAKRTRDMAQVAEHLPSQ